jgi:NADH-quinone oxidoreductase subunit G
MDAVGTNIRLDARMREVMRAVPRLNEDVNEEWANDKTRHAVDGLLRRRSTARGSGSRASCARRAGASVRADRRSREVGRLQRRRNCGRLVDVETMYAAKQMVAAMGSDLSEGRQTGLAYDTSSLGAVNFNTTIAGLETADFILLVGTNPRGKPRSSTPASARP